MKNLKSLLENKDNKIVDLPEWAEVLYIDMDNEKIKFLENKEIPEKVKNNLEGPGSTYSNSEGIYVCLL